jgi:DNA-directed RNA polymerase subunit H (RpoH/RPB5)
MSAAYGVDDVGYETARLKLVDVMGQICTMLRQRGFVITSILGNRCCLDPICGVASAETQTESERMVVTMITALAGVAGPPPLVSITASIPEHPPKGSMAKSHLERGLASVGDEVWVFMFNAGKVGIKQTKLILDAIPQTSSPPPKRVLVVSREKMTTQAEEGIRSEGYILEKFLLQELSYNITRHFLVPKHSMCGEEEIRRLRRLYPKMAIQSRDDPISRFYGMVRGDVIMYQRSRLGSVGALYYREVV